jgi:hypothetical protein
MTTIQVKAGGKHSAAEVAGKAQAVLSEAKLLRAMFDVGYFPPNTPPDECTAAIREPPRACACSCRDHLLSSANRDGK